MREKRLLLSNLSSEIDATKMLKVLRAEADFLYEESVANSPGCV